MEMLRGGLCRPALQTLYLRHRNRVSVSNPVRPSIFNVRAGPGTPPSYLQRV